MSKKQNIRIIDIAKMANVSVGTVDRVLHNRGRVSEEKRKQVEKVLKEINYEPNMVARFLASKKDFSFAVLIPSFKEGDYWELVSRGIARAAAELKDFNVSIDYLFFDQYNNSSFEALMLELEDSSYVGVVVAALQKKGVKEMARQLDEKEIPYVFIDSNIDHCNNLAYYGVNSYTSGMIAAKLMLSEIENKGHIIIVHADYTRDAFSTQMESREQGFLDYLRGVNFEGEISYLPYKPSKKEKALIALRSLVDNRKTGAITFNSRIYEIVALSQTLNKTTPKISLIGYDTIERNSQALKKGKVAYLISQRSIQQGYESIKALSNHLIFNNTPHKNNYMAIDILIQENVEFYKD